ncbi:MAG: cellulase family glycosylhydrolase [Spirochaetes bacterium]|nr:cellulase family glycosylhydrolase [Spirochaetota bacterium]
MKQKRTFLHALIAVLLASTGMLFCDSWGTNMHRGANTGLWLSAGDLTVLRSWGADHVRAQLLKANVPLTPASDEKEATFTDKGWAGLEKFLAAAREAKLKVVIDLHQYESFFPGEWDTNAMNALNDPKRVGKLCAIWKTIAARYKDDRDLIIGYDIMNEPHPPYTPEGYDAWNTIAAKVVEAIRSVDTHHTVIIECGSYGNPGAMSSLKPVKDANTVYSFHMYSPHEFAEQGTRPQWPKGQPYPGMVGIGWDMKTPTMIDKNYMIAQYKPVRDFQLAHNARIWVGEFNAIRSAPDGSAYRYLADCLELYEAYGWSWAYHAFRESSAWDLELSDTDIADKKRHASTQRLDLMKQYLRKNVK